MTNKKTMKIVIDCIILIGLGIIDSFNFKLLIVGNFVPMGINGIAVMIEHVTGSTSGWFSWFSLIANFPLCLITFIFVDKEFALKTYLYVATLSISYLFVNKIDIPIEVTYETTLIPLLMSSVLSGFIYGAVFKRNACTGGMDVLGKIVSFFKPQWNFIWVSFVFSAIVAVSSYFVMGNDVQQVFFCIIFTYVAAFIGNMMLKGTRSAIKVEVVTENAREIGERIIEELHHTATVLQAEGMYKRTKYELLICIINKDQLIDLERILKQYPDTFAYISQVNSTIGLFNRGKH
ncbi:MAG: YitT family protein [Clostridia bacterium]|nr:YitT family protein [Clostridia bacterium]